MTQRFVVPVLLILLVPLAMLYTLGGNPVSAAEDDLIYYFPLRKMVGDSIREGRLPLDNPREATGAPLMGDPQAAVMYPPTWLFAAMDAKAAYSVTLFMAFSLAGLGTFLYLRRLGLLPQAALVGALAFMFCGFMVGHRVHWSAIHTACWLPWGLWCIEGLRTRPGAAAAWMVPPWPFLAIGGGHWPSLIYVGLIWAVYLLLRGRPVVRSLALAAGAMVLAAAIMSPQLAATADLLGQATRQKIGVTMAGENSFFPAAAVLAFFPHIMGSRTPNFFPQAWWGPWHLCEMLGYVGLVTMVLAWPAVRRLYRKPKAGQAPSPLTPIVRTWTWVAIGAGVWMLGYYLMPLFKLIHLIPVLGVVRCPARMVVGVDMALATLAAVAVHAIASGEGAADRLPLLREKVRRTAVVLLPAWLAASVVFLLALACAVRMLYSGGVPFLVGGENDILAALSPSSPALWQPIVLAAVTIGVVLLWLRSPGRRTWMIAALLLADLFFVTRFVDVPSGDVVAPRPDDSPAAAWIRENGPKDQPFRVWGVGDVYKGRPDELLLPKTCQAMGFSTISNYGPMQSPMHARLLGFRIFGSNRDWARLIRQNQLLSLFGVRYVLAEDEKTRGVIESVRIEPPHERKEGGNLLAGAWHFENAQDPGAGPLRLVTPWMWRMSEANQTIGVRAPQVYRISLEARGPDGGAADSLRAEIFQRFDGRPDFSRDELGLTVPPEQIGPEWRTYTWTFLAPPETPANVIFRVFTLSESPIEVRNVAIRESEWETPVDPTRRLAAGEAVYEDQTPQGLPSRRPGEPPVHIYLNRLWEPAKIQPSPATPADVEAALAAIESGRGLAAAPDVSLKSRVDPLRYFYRVSLPAMAVFAGLVAAGWPRRRSRPGGSPA